MRNHDRSSSMRTPGARLLRRYLRAVLADQLAGDRLAEALWPGLPRTVRETEPVDPTLLLCSAMRRWRALQKAGGSAAAFSTAALARAVPPPSDLARQMGILVDVFGLSLSAAAAALDRSEGEAVLLLTESRTRSALPLGKSVLVVEDDPVIAHHLAKIARDAGASDVRIAASGDVALDAARMAAPDLLLCDYELGPGPDGAEVVRRLSAEHDCVCIFVTAFPDLALSGTDGEPTFLIGKPFAEATVMAALRYAGSAERPVLLAA